MARWEEFELDCTNYLNHKFGKYANFIHQGGADSTVADILVKTVSAKYRMKRSGSSSLGKNRVVVYAKLLLNNQAHNYKVTNVRIDGDKLFVSSDKELHNLRFIAPADEMNEYMFSVRNNKYEVRKLSNTCNANVIFSIKLKSTISRISDKDFIDYLLKLN